MKSKKQNAANGSKQKKNNNVNASKKNNTNAANTNNAIPTKPVQPQQNVVPAQQIPETKPSENSQITDSTFQEEKAFMIGDKELNPFMQELFGKLVKATKAANEFPDDAKYQFLTTAYPDFTEALTRESNQILTTISGFQALHKDGGSLVSDLDDVGEQYDSTVDLLDQILENVDSALDELDNPEKNKKVLEVKQKEATLPKVNKTYVNRPQLRWYDVDNSSSPFVPKLKEKPNAIVPLSESLERKQEGGYSGEIQSQNQFPFRMAQGSGVGGQVWYDSYPHPYEKEILDFEYGPQQLHKNTPEPPKGFQKVPCDWVDTLENLHRVAAALDGVSEFAIDLEQHSFRTFQGFVCLMQISTRDRDYLIDTIELREHMYILNTSFTNPQIVKVMHGADCDILWLQRDFGLYIVNLFDTGQASRVLNFPSFSLAYLLKKYCAVDSNKKYQLADWRIRPLPSEMVKYARQDTHYLLYIYDNLKNEVFDKGQAKLLRDTLEKSKELTLRRYEKERFTETAYLQTLQRSTVRGLNREQSEVFRALFKWRDSVARKEDESVRYVLPNHMLLAISEAIPETPQTLLNCCNPAPKLLRRDIALVLKIVQQAAKGQVDEDLIVGKKTLEQAEKEQLASTFANITTPQMERHMNLESPVLTTEELYQSAGWIESTGLTPASLVFDEEDRQPAFPNKKHTSINPKPMSSLFGGDAMDMSSNDFGSYSFDNYLPRGVSTELFTFGAAAPTKESFQTPEAERKKFNRLGFAAGANQDDMEEDIEDLQTPPDERVPQSLNEIYKLSKKNRKRNKQKKKLKEDSVTDPSPAYSPEISTYSQPVEKPEDFMLKIGWIHGKQPSSSVDYPPLPKK